MALFFAELPEPFRKLQSDLLKRLGGDRKMVDILVLVLQHDEQAVLAAIELTLEDGSPAKTHVLLKGAPSRLVTSQRKATAIVRLEIRAGVGARLLCHMHTCLTTMTPAVRLEYLVMRCARGCHILVLAHWRRGA